MSDLIDRQSVLKAIDDYERLSAVSQTVRNMTSLREIVQQLPPAQPQQIVRCKDCKHWKDSDGVYRRGVDAESKCPLNIQEVYAGTFYCGYAERRTDEQID